MTDKEKQLTTKLISAQRQLQRAKGLPRKGQGPGGAGGLPPLRSIYVDRVWYEPGVRFVDVFIDQNVGNYGYTNHPGRPGIRYFGPPGIAERHVVFFRHYPNTRVIVERVTI